MKIIVPAIKKLAKKYGLKMFRIEMVIDSNYIIVRGNSQAEQSLLGADDIEIRIENSLIANPQKLNLPRPLPHEHIILDDLRKKILESVDEYLIFLFKIGEKGEKIELYDFKEAEDKQNAVMDEYRKQFALTNKDTEALHMFFSPYRVVAGLTAEEVKVCIKLCPFRRQQVQSYPWYCQPSLHKSLLEKMNEPISRTEGLKNAMYDLFIDLANRPQISSSGDAMNKKSKKNIGASRFRGGFFLFYFFQHYFFASSKKQLL